MSPKAGAWGLGRGLAWKPLSTPPWTLSSPHHAVPTPERHPPITRLASGMHQPASPWPLPSLQQLLVPSLSELQTPMGNHDLPGHESGTGLQGFLETPGEEGLPWEELGKNSPHMRVLFCPLPVSALHPEGDSAPAFEAIKVAMDGGGGRLGGSVPALPGAHIRVAFLSQAVPCTLGSGCLLEFPHCSFLRLPSPRGTQRPAPARSPTWKPGWHLGHIPSSLLFLERKGFAVQMARHLPV